MPRLTLSLLLLLLAACGGESNPIQPAPPPPPPQPGPAASVAVKAGDNQDGEPGKPVGVKPAVIVKDAEGRPVPGTQVAFAVAAGGGTVDQPTAVTGADGVASPGNWVLGPTVGDNRLSAVVGALPAATVTAHGVFPTVTVADVSFDFAGGTITYSKPGDPMDGLSLKIPVGAFSKPGHWTIDYQPAAAGPVIPQMRIGAPIIGITTDQGMANQPLTLKIPVRVPADSFAMAFFWDSATGYLDPIPLVVSDANSITVQTRHFSTQFLANHLSTTNGLRASAPVNLGLQIVTVIGVRVNIGAAISDYFLNFDSWEFENRGSYVTRDGHPSGWGLSAICWYLQHKGLPPGANPVGLWGHFDQGPFWADDALGYRVAALAEADVQIQQTVYAIQSAQSFNGLVEYNALFFALLGTHRPQLVALSGSAGTVLLVAYELNNAGVKAVDPTNPGQTLFIPFDGQNFQPILVSTMPGVSSSYSGLRMIGVSALVNLQPIVARFNQAASGVVGTAEFPAYAVEYFDEDVKLWKSLPPSLTVTWQDIRLRATCSACAQHIPGANPIESTALAVYDAAANRLVADSTTGVATFRVPVGSNRIGVHILGGLANGAGTTVWRHLDFQYYDIRSSQIYVTPDPAPGQVGVAITFVARNLARNTPPSYTYAWDFGDGTVPVLIANDSTVTHPFKAGGSFGVTVVVKDPATTLVIGRAGTRALIDLPVAIWKLKSWKLVSTSGPVASSFVDRMGQQDAGLTDRLLGRPEFGLIFYQASPTKVGGKTYPEGVFLELGDAFPPTGLDGSLTALIWAQTPASAAYPSPLDALSVSGTLSSGQADGRAVNRYIDVRATCTSAADIQPWIDWKITSTKYLLSLTGTVVRTQRLVDQKVSPDGDRSCPLVSVFAGTSEVATYKFTAVRVK